MDVVFRQYQTPELFVSHTCVERLNVAIAEQRRVAARMRRAERVAILPDHHFAVQHARRRKRLEAVVPRGWANRIILRIAAEVSHHDGLRRTVEIANEREGDAGREVVKHGPILLQIAVVN